MRHSDRRRISRRDFFKAAGLTVATLAALGGGAYALQRWDDSQNAVSVADTGIGMSEEVRAHIFDKYYQGNPNGSGRGLGLGLSIVQRIVELCGGQIQVDSVEDQGSTFTVRLPRAG